MIVANSTDPSIMSKETAALVQEISKIVNKYAIPTVSSIGLVVNILCMIVLKSTKQNTVYKYLFFKTLIDSFILFIGIGYAYKICYRTICQNMFTEYYIVAIYSSYIFIIFRRCLFMTSIFIIISNNINRYLSLRQMKNLFYNLRGIVVAFFSLIFFCLQTIPSFYSIQVADYYNRNTTSYLYTIEYVKPSTSNLYRYISFTGTTLLIFPAFLLIYSWKLLNRTINIRRILLKKREIKLNKICNFLTLVLIIQILCEVGLIIIWLFESPSILKTDFKHVLIMLRDLTLMLNFLLYSLNTLIILLFDGKIIKRIRKKKFCD